MNEEPAELARRTVLQMAVGMATVSAPSLAAAKSLATPPAPTGKPGDFDFLAGEWKIWHEQFKNGAWDRFEGEATVHTILGGVGSVEELRIPARQFSGMGLRLLDVERKLWADYWVNASHGVLTPPPSWGSFVGGVGLWDSDEFDGDKPIIVRGAWDRITSDACRWYQATSDDGGQSWKESWVMHWSRV